MEMKGRVYISCVRSRMTHGSETTPLLFDDRKKTISENYIMFLILNEQ